MEYLITIKEAEKIMNCKDKVDVSLDLGITFTTVYARKGFAFVKEQKILLQAFKRVKEDSCYIIEEDALKKLAFFSDQSNFYYKLFPTEDWPTITFSSTPMHRHTLISPKKDALSKIKEVSPITGKVLDTCCGLGYTSILASKQATHVYTFERDRYVLHLAGFNPYSKELFNNKKIKISEEDVFDGIRRFADCFFDRIIHDPPTFKYSPNMYSKEFYSQVYRVLKKGGILYHYAPWPKKTQGKTFYTKIIRNLKEAGFQSVGYHPDSSGVRAVKV